MLRKMEYLNITQIFFYLVVTYLIFLIHEMGHWLTNILSIYQIFSHKTAAWALIVSNHIPRGFKSNQKIIDAELKVLKGFFQKYRPRSDSWNKTKINGLPVIQFIADYKDKNNSMVEYRSYHFTNQRYTVLFLGFLK